MRVTTTRGQGIGRWLGAIALGVLGGAWLLTGAARTPVPSPPPGAATPAPLDLTAMERREDEALARRYAPIMYIKAQSEPCDTDGEQYLPAPVDIVFGDTGVTLRQAPDADIVARGIASDDLFARDARHYIDLRGHPRTPGCDYETHFKQLMGDQRPVIYAHIATEAGEPGLALQ